MTCQMITRLGFNFIIGAGGRALLATATLFGMTLIANLCFAQLTSQVLIGDSVSEAGKKFPDIDEAIKRFGNRDYLGARQFLESAKRSDPTLPPADLILAKMYFLTGDVAAGRMSLEKTVMDNSGDPEAYLILADQAAQPAQNRTIEAEALYEKALQLTDSFKENAKRKRNFDIRAHSGRAFVSERRKNWQKAVEDLQAMLKTDPDNAAGHYRLGRALFMMKKYKEGYDEFVASKKLDKEKAIPNPYVSAASMYDALNMPNEAKQAFDLAIKEDGKNIGTLTSYAQWLIKTGKAEDAAKVLAEARKIDPNSLDVLTLSGVAARMSKQLKPAEDYFVAALAIAPSNGGVINQLALLLVDQPDDDKRRRALEFAGINARLNDKSADAQVTYAWVLFQLQRLAEAQEALRMGIRLGNLGQDSSYLVAKMISDQNVDAAKRLLTDALESDNPGIFVNRREAQELLDSLNKK